MLVGREVRVWLDEPPRVASVGVGVHGESVRRETFRLPDLWQFHLYRYAAELTVDGEVFAIRPGHVSLVPPGSVVEFRYRGGPSTSTPTSNCAPPDRRRPCP